VKKFLKTTTKLLAGILLLAACWFVAGVFWPLSVPEAEPAPGRLLITDTTVVDVRHGVLKPGQDILIEDGEIITVGENLDAGVAEIVSGRDRFVIPGLFDMHMHSIKLSPVLTHPLFVAAGVTSVRDMGGCIGIEDAWVACAEEKRAWNREVSENRMVGPRFDEVTSLAINGGQEIPASLDLELGAASPHGARQRVSYDAARGIDFLKPYTRIPRDSYFALAQAASENGMYLAGHQPLAVTGLEAVSAGQRSIEHAFLFIWECYPGMASLRTGGDPRSLYTDEARRAMITGHDESLCTELHRAMARTGSAFVPTHTTRKLDAFALDYSYRNDPRLIYIPGPLRMLWLEDADGMAQRTDQRGRESYRDFYRFGIEQTGVAHAAGVQVLAGTDAPDSFAFPGTGLHDELGHLVEAGLTPLDALRAATFDAAEFLRLDGKAGVVEAGARADLVLLTANPLDDIANVRNVDSVVLAGAVYDRTRLDALLAGVEQSAGHWSMWPKFIWQLLNSPIMRKQFAD
jgi:imidazolonepropionase-like amidohydrolase